jgi:hypothetical protein
LKRELTGHQVSTVQERGRSSKKNGELLQHAAGQAEVFITADQNLRYQQRAHRYPLHIIVLVASGNRYPTLKPLMPEAQDVLLTIQPGEIVEVPRSVAVAERDAGNGL